LQDGLFDHALEKGGDERLGRNFVILSRKRIDDDGPKSARQLAEFQTARWVRTISAARTASTGVKQAIHREDAKIAKTVCQLAHHLLTMRLMLSLMRGTFQFTRKPRRGEEPGPQDKVYR
jgi:hypothetical protein